MQMPFDANRDISDEALLVLYANGDAAAARALTLRLTPRVFGHANRLLGDRAEAEDVAQEALLRLWKIAPDWRQDEARVATWLYRVVANLCTDRLRKRRGVALDAVPEPEDGAASPAEVMQERARVIPAATHPIATRCARARHHDRVAALQVRNRAGQGRERLIKQADWPVEIFKRKR